MDTAKSQSASSCYIRLCIAAGLGTVIWYIPAPDGVTAEAWHLLAMFVATIVAIMLEPLPMGAVAMLGLAATTLTGTLSIGDALGTCLRSLLPSRARKEAV